MRHQATSTPRPRGVHVELLDGDIDLRRNVLALPGGQADLVRGQQGSPRFAASTRWKPVSRRSAQSADGQIVDFVGAFADGQRGVEEIGREFHLPQAHGQSAGRAPSPARRPAGASGRNDAPWLGRFEEAETAGQAHASGQGEEQAGKRAEVRNPSSAEARAPWQRQRSLSRGISVATRRVRFRGLGSSDVRASDCDLFSWLFLLDLRDR